MKMLRVNFSLEILLHLTGLKRCSFFYHLQLKIDKNVAIRQEIVEIYRKNDGNYGYRRITLALRKINGIINSMNLWTNIICLVFYSKYIV